MPILKYSKEIYEGKLEEFGGDFTELRNSSHSNFLLCEAALKRGWRSPQKTNHYDIGEFERILFGEFGGDRAAMRRSSRRNRLMMAFAIRHGYAEKRPRLAKTSRADFFKYLDSKFGGSVRKLFLSGGDDRELYRYAVRHKYVEPLRNGIRGAMYTRESFLEELNGRFGGSMYEMRRSSSVNRRMCEAAVMRRWVEPYSGRSSSWYSVYLVSFAPVDGLGISVYVGLTSRNPDMRLAEHVCSDPWHLRRSSVRSFMDEHPSASHNMVVVGKDLSPAAAASLERTTIAHYSSLGWNVLNKSGGGEMGSIGPMASLGKTERVLSEIVTFSELRSRRGVYMRLRKMAKSDPEWRELRDRTYARIGQKMRKARIANLTRNECVERLLKHGSVRELARKDEQTYRYMIRNGTMKSVAYEAGVEYHPFGTKRGTPFYMVNMSEKNAKPITCRYVTEAIRILKTDKRYIKRALSANKDDANAHIVKGWYISFMLPQRLPDK